MLRALLILLVTIFLFSCLPKKEEKVKVVVRATPFLNVDYTTTDSLLKGMTLEEKIGQVIFLKTSIKNNDIQEVDYQLVKQGLFGGVLINDATVKQYIRLIDTLNFLSKRPLLVGTEQAVVLNNQFSDAVNFPLPPSIGSIQNDTTSQKLEALYLQQCKNLGVRFCITPSANRIKQSDKKYPLHIFENNSEVQAKRINRVLQNLQKEKILSFGNTFSEFRPAENDSLGITRTLLSRQRNLVKNGVSGFVVDEKIFREDTLLRREYLFLQKYLKKEIDFEGLLIGKITKEATVEKLVHSGVDIFIVQDSVKALFNHLLGLVKQGIMSEKKLDESVRKILLSKSYAGLDERPPVLNLKKAEATLKNERFEYDARRLFEQSITLAWNHNDLLPYTKTYHRDFRIINVGNEDLETFKLYFSKYGNYQNINHRPDKEGKISPIKTVFLQHSTSILILDNIDLDTLQQRDFVQSINDLSKDAQLTIINFGNPLNLQYLDTTMTLIQVFEKNEITESLVPQLLFGGMSAQGKLPIELKEHLPYGKSISTPITRLKYTVPQEVGIAPEKLVGIDAIIESAIRKKATPGAQVLVIKGGKVIFDKSFGFQTYDKKKHIQNYDLYDLASLTKVSATTLAAMKLYENKKFKLQDRLKSHLPLEKDATIGRITFKQLLTHTSGLQANMPIGRFYRNEDTLVGNCNEYFCENRQDDYSVQVANKMYLNKKWIDSIWYKIDHLKIKRRGRYKYSDVNFDLLQRVMERKTKQTLDDYLNREFYRPLNLRRTAYRPLKKFKATHIVPTENDTRWRKQLLKGYVHDESASLLGGVAGNAGLFSNANDLAILFQMLLNGGTYGGKTYLKSSTIKKFTKKTYRNRGLGFVVKGKRKANSISSKSSRKTFGHTGFTGTCVWVDPKNDLIYIFLSNRVYPKKSNTKLFRYHVRRRIHDVIYKSLNTY